MTVIGMRATTLLAGTKYLQFKNVEIQTDIHIEDSEECNVTTQLLQSINILRQFAARSETTYNQPVIYATDTIAAAHLSSVPSEIA